MCLLNSFVSEVGVDAAIIPIPFRLIVIFDLR